jgi:hypothetical protein
MKLARTEHFSQPWRIHELTRDFRLEDVWALPTPGRREDFPRLVQMVASLDDARQRVSLVGVLFAIREGLGRLFGWTTPPTTRRDRACASGYPRTCATPPRA